MKALHTKLQQQEFDKKLIVTCEQTPVFFGSGTNEERAAHIVSCVNMHDELMVALRLCRNLALYDQRLKYPELLKDVDALLAKVKGE